MRGHALLAILALFLFAGSAPALASRLTVTAVEKDGTPVGNALIRVMPAFSEPGSGPVTSQQRTAADGTITAEKYDDGAPLGDVVQVIVFVPKGYATYGDEGTGVLTAVSKAVVRRFVYLKPGESVALEIDLHGWRPVFYETEELKDRADKAKEAAKKCDKATYERYTGVLKDYIAGLKGEIADLEKALDAWADDRKLPRASLAEARKSVKAAEAVQASLRDRPQIERLKTYVERLEDIEDMRKQVREAEAILKSVPAFKECPAEAKSHGMRPGACPEGQGGGLLARTLNEAFDAGIEPLCEDATAARGRGDKDHERD
jgi:hypothetical protein